MGEPEEGVRGRSKEEQMQVMEGWFRSLYEDPAIKTPYESAEGGYIYVWGGPFHPEEELRAEFEGSATPEAIEELATRLNRERYDWAPIETGDDEDQGLYESISSNEAARKTLDDALGIIRWLLEVQVPDALRESYLRMLFANVISAMESFFSDTFINHVMADRELLQKYIDAEQRFGERRIQYKDVLREAANLESEARRELLDTVWHNIAKVKAMYARVLSVNLADVERIAKAVQTRHDIVHRNGRQRDGKWVIVTDAEIKALIADISDVASRVDLKLDYGLEVEDFDGVG